MPKSTRNQSVWRCATNPFVIISAIAALGLVTGAVRASAVTNLVYLLVALASAAMALKILWHSIDNPLDRYLGLMLAFSIGGLAAAWWCAARQASWELWWDHHVRERGGDYFVVAVMLAFIAVVIWFATLWAKLARDGIDARTGDELAEFESKLRAMPDFYSRRNLPPTAEATRAFFAEAMDRYRSVAKAVTILAFTLLLAAFNDSAGVTIVGGALVAAVSEKTTRDWIRRALDGRGTMNSE